MKPFLDEPPKLDVSRQRYIGMQSFNSRRRSVKAIVLDRTRGGGVVRQLDSDVSRRSCEQWEVDP